MFRNKVLWFINFFTLAVAHQLLNVRKSSDFLKNSTDVTVEFYDLTNNKSSTTSHVSLKNLPCYIWKTWFDIKC